MWAPQQGRPFAFDGHPNPYLSLLWPYALQHPVLFEGIVAMCRASWLLEHGYDTLQDRGLAYHHNNTKHSLQKRLDNPETCADDTTMLTVLALTTIDVSLTRLSPVLFTDPTVHTGRACLGPTVSAKYAPDGQNERWHQR